MSCLLFVTLSVEVSEARGRRREGKSEPVVDDPSIAWMGLAAALLLLLLLLAGREEDAGGEMGVGPAWASCNNEAGIGGEVDAKILLLLSPPVPCG